MPRPACAAAVSARHGRNKARRTGKTSSSLQTTSTESAGSRRGGTCGDVERSRAPRRGGSRRRRGPGRASSAAGETPRLRRGYSTGRSIHKRRSSPAPRFATRRRGPRAPRRRRRRTRWWTRRSDPGTCARRRLIPVDRRDAAAPRPRREYSVEAATRVFREEEFGAASARVVVVAAATVVVVVVVGLDPHLHHPRDDVDAVQRDDVDLRARSERRNLSKIHFCSVRLRASSS